MGGGGRKGGKVENRKIGKVEMQETGGATRERVKRGRREDRCEAVRRRSGKLDKREWK